MKTLRSVLVGDCDHYFSPFIFGVQQGMSHLGHWHTQVNIRQDLHVIWNRIADVRPDVLWGHMLLWAPQGSPRTEQLVELCIKAKRQWGTRVVIHDGDYKDRTRHAQDISSWCALALCNHKFDRSAWKIPALHWPYFAFAQDAIAPADSALGLGDKLFFAGQVIRGDATYGARTQLLDEVSARGVPLRVQDPADGNTLFRTAAIAASAQAVLGFGRPGVDGWVDTRVFQYISAGGILLHDDVGGYFEPWVHYVPYASSDASSVVESMDRLCKMSTSEQMSIRTRGFAHGQNNHSSVVRCLQVLQKLGLL